MEGKQAEELAVQYLRTQGMRIVARNWRWRGGEIDIIAKDGDTLVFVEVKGRTSPEFLSPQEAVDHRKRLHLWRSAQAYLQGKPAVPVRFDVVAVTPAGIHHIRGAFQEEDVRASA
ncbi:MAG: YraN family protein [Candidatus Bipolaricaulota bacterium]|nr:YraN family protein [Candidatus Bipolaricaulota bacterium]MDW8126667.1 YraN family protein [Candidatus Bipolaricaulota bacterium]